LEIINDVLDIAKAEAGKFELVDGIVDCRNVLQAVSPLVRTRMETAGLAFAMNIPDNLPRLRADLRKLKQILINLLSNAVKFTPAGGRVEVSISADRLAGLTLAVRDSGIGIAPKHLAKVLQPFYQVDSSLSRRHPGTGLGLPLVALMMQQHGGTLRLESALGKGTTAYISFPSERLIWSDAQPKLAAAAKAPPQDHTAAAVAAPTKPIDSASRPAAILIVDDDDDARELCRRSLSQAGYTALTARNGIEALNCLRKHPADLVVTDMLMPEMDGVELMRTLRAEQPALPVIVISGADEWEKYLGIAANLGAKATLRKPIQTAQLAEAVAEALDIARHRRQTAAAD
jgi:CheY-like chemotaxis protein